MNVDIALTNSITCVVGWGGYFICNETGFDLFWFTH